ncbi:MAG: T9SS type A sorting domain-containing protein [Flavobacteriales bacterium]|nr:T9SS type A sorting domain-containing protein [Flavobacteriales bacterium]
MVKNILWLRIASLFVFVIALTNLSFAQTMQNHVTQREFTWTFDKEYQTGQFVNGDWWVVGPVTVVSVTPAERVAIEDELNGTGDNYWGDSGLQDDETVRNGSVVVDKLRGDKQGFDSRGVGFDASLPIDFPYTLEAHTSMISSKSNDTIPQKVMYHELVNYNSNPQFDDSHQPTPIKTVSVLTCLSKVPPADAFRPSYVKAKGGVERKLFTLSDVNYDALLDLAPTAKMPSWSQFERYFERPWLNHFNGSWLGQKLFPTEMNQPYYGREYARIVGQAALMLNTDASDEQKKKLLVGMLQLGIDLRGIAEIGGRWAEGGGLTGGRKMPIIFAYKIFDDPYFLDMPFGSRFHEDTETYYGRGWAGQAALWQIVVHHGKRKPYMEQDPSVWPEWDMQNGTAWGSHSESYRLCCNTEAWASQALTILLMEGKEAWNHNAFFDNVDDWMRVEDLYKDDRGSAYPRPYQEGKSNPFRKDPFVNEMWVKYRTEVPEQAGGKDNKYWNPNGLWMENDIIKKINKKSVTEGEILSVNIETVVSSDVAKLTLSSDNLPSFCTLVDDGKGSAVITVAPGMEDEGTYIINLKAVSLSFTEFNTTFDLVVENSLSIGDDNLKKPSFVIFPNPNKGDQLSIEINNKIGVEKASLSIIDMSGRNVIKNDVEINEKELLQVNVSQLKKGIYFVVIDTDLWSERMKFIVE